MERFWLFSSSFWTEESLLPAPPTLSKDQASLWKWGLVAGSAIANCLNPLQGGCPGELSPPEFCKAFPTWNTNSSGRYTSESRAGNNG